jgi:putative Holliday junction resolvase
MMLCADETATRTSVSDSAPAASNEGTVLAFDFGTKRIGVASGDTLMRLAHPLSTIEAEGNAVRFAAIAALVNEWQPVMLVVGLPRAIDGTAHDMTLRCQRFANQLSGRFRLPVLLVDERWSSVEAEGMLSSGSKSSRQHKRQIDALAAQVILQSYFDSGSTIGFSA